MHISPSLKAPFPYFGGKSRIAAKVWERFGDVPNYVEPFAGSLAVLLARPHSPRIETVNDADGWLTNFWRAVQQDPDRVAAWADWPVSELDLHARGDWLFYRHDAAEFVKRMRADPDYCCFKSAGWWVWGACAWIGSGWGRKLPHVGNAGQGVHRQLPHVGNAGQGVHRQLPHVGSAGRGIHRQLPHVGDAGRGIHRQLPHVGGDVRLRLKEYFRDLSDRLRRVRVLCGDWTRALNPSVTVGHGTTAVFLDPPYGQGAIDYAAGGNATTDLSQRVRDWAVEHGADPALRIALCGYEGIFEMPGDWECFAWKARGGYGSQSDGDARANARRERVWFSPHCTRPDTEPDLFAGVLP